MKRLIPFMPVLIVAILLFAFASRTEQGATIRADVRKRMTQVRDGMQAMATGAEDVAVDAQAMSIEVETVAD